MGFYGDELFDVLAAFGFSDGSDTVEIEPGALETAINTRRTEARLAGRGLTVLFRAARYIISRRESGTAQPPWLADLVLREFITVWFAPGAVLAPEREVIVDIEGPIVAETTRIFDEAGGDGGMIVLGGDLDAVHPEWWGVGKDLDDADALQRAIDAATIRRRPVVNRIGKRLSEQLRRPLPVSLRQLYKIRRPLWCGSLAHMARSSANEGLMRLAESSADTFGLRLIGVRTGTLRRGAIIAADTDFAPVDQGPSALLVMFNSAGAEVSNVGFVGDQRAAFGAIVTLTPGQPHAIAFEDCSFTGATEVQLHLGPPQELLDAGTVVRAQRDNSNVLSIDGAAPTFVSVPISVQEGEFHPGGLDLSALRILRCDFAVDAATPARGIVLRASNTLPLHVQRCTFSGTASAMVHIIAGSALLDGCSFDNLASVNEHPNPRLFTAGAISVLSTGFEAPNGVDVFLSADVLTVDRAWQPRNSRNGPFTELDLERGAAEPASYCTAFGCSSRSGRFFGTVRPTTVWDSRFERSTLLYAVDHRPAGALQNPVRPTGVSWGWRRFALNSRLTPMEAQTATTNTSNTRLQMTYDPALCVVASRFPTGLEVFYGATQSAIFGTVLGGLAEPVVWFREVLAGIRMPTSVFGRGSVIPIIPFTLSVTLVLMLVGCERTRPTSADAGAADAIDALEIPDDLVVVKLDARPADRSTRDGSPADVPSDLDVDAATVVDAVADADGVLLTDLGPARQMRAECPEPTDGDPTIPAPRLVFPLSPMRATSRRPTLIWELAPGLTGARIEICRDRCCRSVIATLDATGTSVRPLEMLPPGVVFWRTRGRRGEQVGRATSFTWEFSVRHRDSETDTAFGSIYDFNGDGYDDFVVHAQLRYPEGDDFLIFWGSSAGPRPEQFQRLRAPADSLQPGSGDFNGDGLADLYVHVNDDEIRGQEKCRTYESTRAGVGPVYRDVLCGPSRPAIGDYNGDGYSDVVNLQVQPATQPLFYTNSFQVIYGGPAGHGSGGRSEFGDPAGPRRPNLTTAFTSPGDVNGDGYADVILADYSIDSSNGRAWIYWGSVSGIRQSDPVEIRSAVLDESVEFGARVTSVGDLNQDRRSDFIVAEGSRAMMRLFLGSNDTAILAASIERPDPVQPRVDGEPAGNSLWGEQNTVTFGLFGGITGLLATCDRCADAVDAGIRGTNGRGYLYRWDSSREALELIATLRAEGGAGRVFGVAVVSARDLNGDGYDDVVIGDYGAELGDGVIHFVPGGAAGPVWSARRTVPAPQSMSSLPYHAFGLHLSQAPRPRGGVEA